MADPASLAQTVMARAATAATFLAFDGLPPAKPSKGYVVHYFGAGAPRVSDMTGRQNGLRWTYSAVCVGFSPAQCRLVVKSYRTLMLNWPPVSARDGWLSESEDDPPLITESSVEGDVRHSITLRYIYNTTRSI